MKILIPALTAISGFLILGFENIKLVIGVGLLYASWKMAETIDAEEDLALFNYHQGNVEKQKHKFKPEGS